MGTGQMMLTVGGLILLTTLSLSVNRVLIANDDTMRQSQRELQAVSRAQNLIEEAMSLSYDQHATGLTTFAAADSASLGPESGETYAAGYNDVDDFNGFDHTVTVGGDSYRIRARVGYVNPAAAAHVAQLAQGPWVQWSTAYASSRSYYKKMEVRVSCPGMPIQIGLTQLFSFRP